MTNFVEVTTLKSKNTVVIAIPLKRERQSRVFLSGKGDCFVVSLLAMTNWKIILKIIAGILVVAGCGLADEITKTFIQGENGYDGFESTTIANAGHVEKTPLNWWPNNALNRKNDIAADVSEFRC